MKLFVVIKKLKFFLAYATLSSWAIGACTFIIALLLILLEPSLHATSELSVTNLLQPPQSNSQQLNLNISEILSDKENLISTEFKIPNILKKRTKFWFDIYTKYDSNYHVIHHVKYPWIIFDVINTNTCINSTYTNGPSIIKLKSWCRTELQK